MSGRYLRPVAAVLLPLLAAVAVQLHAHAAQAAKSGVSPVPSKAPAAPPPQKANDVPPPAKSDAPPPMAPAQTAPVPAPAPAKQGPPPAPPPPATQPVTPPHGPVYKSPPPDPSPAPSPGTGYGPQFGPATAPPVYESVIDYPVADPPTAPVVAPPTAPVSVHPGPIHSDAPRAPISFDGRFRSRANGDLITIRRTREGFHYMTGPDWDGVGFFDGQVYRGVFRFELTARDSAFAGTSGWHFIEMDGPALLVQAELETQARDQFSDTWTALPAEDPEAKGVLGTSTLWEDDANDPEAHVDSTPVDELPVAIRRVAPRYPDTARARGVEGTVTVRARVLEDGTVGDVRVIQSVPALDEAAVDCVRQWEFNPALTRGKPVATWVVLPITFDRQTAVSD